MAASIPHFSQTVAETENNSWWSTAFGPNAKPREFTYAIDANGVESITEVPKEPFEALLLRVRRLTMNDSSEQLHVVRRALKQKAAHDRDRELLDVWHKYWRLAFIKEPFEIDNSSNRQIMTRYKVYDCFINGQYFHSNDPEYNVILYGSSYGSAAPHHVAQTFLFFRNMFHSTVVDVCFAAIALDRFIRNGNSFCEIPLNGIATAFDFIGWRNCVEQLDEQYRIFHDWIEGNGGCKKCRWT